MRKYGLIWLLLLIILSVFVGIAVADETVFFCVTSETSDRVHLRAGPSSRAESMGLYFVGTPVIVYPQVDEEWLQVTIGAETGYMYCDRLTPVRNAYEMPVQWRQASVKPSSSDSWVNLRIYPSKDAPVLQKKEKGEPVFVLGETKDRWCYVRSGDVYGYIMSKYLRIGEAASYARIYDPNIRQPVDIHGEWYFAGGAGAWSTVMYIFPDGRFMGYFHDWDAIWEDDEDGSCSATYESLFTGRFSVAQKISDWEYRMVVEHIQDLSSMEMYEEDENMHIPTTPYGVEKDAQISIYLPGASQNELPESYCWQMENYPADINSRMGLYCFEHDAAWI